MSDLEQRVGQLEADLAELRRLTGSVDRDQSTQQQTLSAMRHLIQALSITQSEHTETLAAHTDALGRIEAGMNGITTMLQELLRRG